MSMKNIEDQNQNWPQLKMFPMPAKALVSAVILTMALAMAGAMGQIIVHDIVPTFFSESNSANSEDNSMPGMAESPVVKEGDKSSRGDLLSEESMEMPAEKPSLFKSVLFSSCEKGWKMVSSLFLVIPVPVSEIMKSRLQ